MKPTEPGAVSFKRKPPVDTFTRMYCCRGGWGIHRLCVWFQEDSQSYPSEAMYPGSHCSGGAACQWAPGKLLPLHWDCKHTLLHLLFHMDSEDWTQVLTLMGQALSWTIFQPPSQLIRWLLRIWLWILPDAHFAQYSSKCAEKGTCLTKSCLACGTVTDFRT